MYHNHDGEFKKIDNKPIIEHLAEKISPELMGFTLDVFWVQAGGGDPGILQSGCFWQCHSAGGL